MISLPFNFVRFVAIIRKEFIQMRRDRLTFAMMFGIPVIQLVLFGFAINTDPKNLPVAVLASDNSPFARRLVHAMENSGYFKIVDHVETEEAAQRLLARGEVQFVLNFLRTSLAGSFVETTRQCSCRPTPPIPLPSALPCRSSMRSHVELSIVTWLDP